MKTFYITTGLLAVASMGFAQSSAPVAGSTTAATAPADARVSNGHIHLFTKDPEVQQHFGVDIMGATASKKGPDRDIYTLPKVLVIVDKGNPTAGTEGSIVNHVGLRVRDMKDILDKVATETPATGTKGRALDHIGFEVKDLEGFCKTLEANGIKLDTPYRKVPQMGFAVAFLTDPWGTRIELTERSAPSPQPAQQ